MIFDEPVMDVIRRRTSRRSYTDQPMEDAVKQQLETFLAQQTKGPLDSDTRFMLVTATAEDQNALKGLGTYGFIKNASAFITGAVKPGEKNLEDYGYMLEKIILFATHLNLGTCWMGGSFNKSNFSRKINAGTNELVPAVTPVGYAHEKRAKRDKLIRWGAGSKKRLPWDVLFFDGDFDTPLSTENAGDYAEPLEMVRLGPSASNRQPWRIVKEKDKPEFHFFVQRTKGYDKNEKLFNMVDLQRIDLGIGMCHFELTAADLDLKGQWRLTEPIDIPLPERTEYVATWAAS